MMPVDEKERLESIANDSVYNLGLSRICAQYCGQVFMKHMVDGSVLELGPAEGMMTEILYPNYSYDYTVVDAGTAFINQIKARFVGINGIISLFEDFEPKKKYKNIILGHVLEHVIDPAAILKLCKEWLDDDGVILAAVPNANSLHRQAAVEMGILKTVEDFSEKDRRHGHRRVFFQATLAKCFEEANLYISTRGGYWLKPLSDAQIEKNWTMEMIGAFLKMGEKYPDIAGEIYVVAGKGE